MSPVAMAARALTECIMTSLVRSASRSIIIASNAKGTVLRISADAAMMSWQSVGLRFCGIVELPTVPGGTGSSTSPNSVFINV
jgi:hypothetical protein